MHAYARISTEARTRKHTHCDTHTQEETVQCHELHQTFTYSVMPPVREHRKKTADGFFVCEAMGDWPLASGLRVGFPVAQLTRTDPPHPPSAARTAGSFSHSASGAQAGLRGRSSEPLLVAAAQPAGPANPWGLPWECRPGAQSVWKDSDLRCHSRDRQGALRASCSKWA